MCRQDVTRKQIALNEQTIKLSQLHRGNNDVIIESVLGNLRPNCLSPRQRASDSAAHLMTTDFYWAPDDKAKFAKFRDPSLNSDKVPFGSNLSWTAKLWNFSLRFMSISCPSSDDVCSSHVCATHCLLLSVKAPLVSWRDSQSSLHRAGLSSTACSLLW